MVRKEKLQKGTDKGTEYNHAFAPARCSGHTVGLLPPLHSPSLPSWARPVFPRLQVKKESPEILSTPTQFLLMTSLVRAHYFQGNYMTANLRI